MYGDEAPMKITFKIQGPSGSKVFKDIEATCTFKELYKKINEEFSLEGNSYILAKLRPYAIIEYEIEDPIGIFIESGDIIVIECFFLSF